MSPALFGDVAASEIVLKDKQFVLNNVILGDQQTQEA